MTCNKLDNVYLKIERAKKHIVEVDALRKSFHDSRPYLFSAYKDSESGQVVYHLTHVDCVPAEIPLITGEVIHALRSALDHLTFHIWQANGGTGKESSVYFPTAEDATKYEAALLEKIEGVPDAVQKAFRAVEAYKGGNGHDLWVLNALNNTDKHRALLTAGSIHRSFDLGSFVARDLQSRGEEFWGPNPPQKLDLSGLGLQIPPANTSFPAKVGDVLLVVGGDVEIDKDADFTMEVAFNEPGIIEGKPIMETLPKLVDVVNNVTAQLAKFV